MTPRFALSTLAALVAAASAPRAQAVHYGQGCVGASGIIPVFTFEGYPVVGGTFDLWIHGPPDTFGFLVAGLVGFDPGIPLVDVGLPFCELYLLSVATVPIALDGTGTFLFDDVPVWQSPNDTLYVQAFVEEAGDPWAAASGGLSITSLAPSGNVGGELVISEVNGASTVAIGPPGRWLELINTTDGAIDVEGWSIETTGGVLLLDAGGAGLVVQPGEHVSIGGEGDPLLNGGLHHFHAGLPLEFPPDGGFARVVDHTGIEIDRIDYAPGWPLAVGASFALDPASIDHVLNDDPSAWALSTCTLAGAPCNPDLGTPGTPNDACTTAPCGGVGTGELIVTELMPDPLSASDLFGEWIEVENAGEGPMDLDGVLVVSLASNGTTAALIEGTHVLESKERALLALDTNPILNGGLPIVDALITGIVLDDAAGTIELYAADATLLSRLDYSPALGFPAQSGFSMALDPAAHTAGLYDDGANWCLGQGVYGFGDVGTPGAPNFSCPVPDAQTGEVVIVEMHRNPAAVGDSSGEWFEIVNTSGTLLDLQGWVLRDDGIDHHVISAAGPLLLGPGGRLVLGPDMQLATNGGAPVGYEYDGFALGNGTDEIVIENAKGQLVDRVAYDDASFPQPDVGRAAGFDETLGLDPTLNDFGAHWCNQTTAYGDGDLGTPGAVNDVCP